MNVPVLFDFDGTLMATEPAIHESFREVFRLHGNVEDFDERKQIEVLGPPLDVMMMKYFPHLDPDVLKKEYREYQNAHLTELVKPYEYARELLAELKEKGYKIGVVSTRRTDSINRIMDTVGMPGVFDVTIGFESVTKQKPDPEGVFLAKELLGYSADTPCIYIGDSPADIQCGKNAGAYTIAMISHPGKKEDVLAQNPDAVVYHLKDVLDIIENYQRNEVQE